MIRLDPVLMQMRNSCNLVVVSNLSSFVVRCYKESLKSVGNSNLLTQLQFENSNFLCGCSELLLVLRHQLVLQQCACLWLQKIFILGVPSMAETVSNKFLASFVRAVKDFQRFPWVKPIFKSTVVYGICNFQKL
jgi:hypothetical protein